MIYESINLIKDKLDAYLQLKLPLATGHRATFIGGSEAGQLSFIDRAINIALLNIHEESLIRIQSFQETEPGEQPSIGINLDVFFIAHAKDNYSEALQLLSHTIQFFTENRVLDHDNAPDLDESIWRLIIELQSLDISDTREAWQIMDYAKNKPAVFYQVKLLIFTQSQLSTSGKITGINSALNNR